MHPGLTDRWILAGFSGVAGIVHIAMAPSHMEVSTLEGWGFVAAAWLQLGLAAGLLLSPARGFVRASIAVNAVLIGLWAISRTVGLPFGPHAFHPEAVTLVDGVCVTVELLLVGLAAVWLLRPGLLRLGGSAAVAVPLVAFGIASAALASPAARDHATTAHGAHGASGEEASGHGHGAEAAPDDKGLSLLENGHQHETGVVELDDETQAALTAQLVRTAELVERYPTVAVAEAQGARRTGPFTPGLGSHFLPAGYTADGDGVLDEQDLLDPVLIFDGNEPDSPIAGFMYYMMGEEEPEGFAGPNDHWHYHTHTCTVFNADGTVDTPFGADDSSVTDEMCAEVGGEMLQTTGWMVHVWTVPGYESERGVFSEINPKLTCPDGTYYQIPWKEVGLRDSFCRNP